MRTTSPGLAGLTLVCAALCVGAMAPPVRAAAPATAARDAAIFKAAGLRLKAGTWASGCNDSGDTSSDEPGKVEMVKDLNGDGRPDAIVTEGSGYCYGEAGAAFWLVSQRADGNWTLLYKDTGIATPLATKGAGGWPDIEVGGPGFCFPVMRWNGRAYVKNRLAYEGKPCKR